MEGSFSNEDERRRTLMEAIFREHFTAVHRYISGRVRQPDVVDDLTSIVFLKAFRWLGEDRGMKQVRSWLYATARSAIADYWQEQQKNLFLPLEELEDSAIVLFEPHDDEQTQERVYHLLHLLPERERLVLLLRYFQGYSTAEIGQELGLNTGHVRVLQLRALRHAALLKVQERSLSEMNEPTNRPVTIYTEQGQRVLDLAKEEALSFNHYYIGTEHLLLGLLSEGSVTAPLIEQGATLARVRAELLAVVGKNEPDTRAGALLTPRSQHVLEMAGKVAEEHGEAAISPDHILQGVLSEKRGIAVQMLRSIGVNLDNWQAVKYPPSAETNARYIRILEHHIAKFPQLDEEEERRLAHLIAHRRTEQRRAELLKEAPDVHIVEEGNAAYFKLIEASQHLVLSVAKEYASPERDMGEIINEGNMGLSLATFSYGLNMHTPFSAYAIHQIHLRIMDALG